MGIWTLDNDRGYSDLNDVLRLKFYHPSHTTAVSSGVTKVSRSAGQVRVRHFERVKNTGNVPERGTLTWRIFDRSGRLLKKGSTALTIYPGKTRTFTTTSILGSTALRAGIYQLKVQYVSRGGLWKAPVDRFRQPY